MIERDTRKEAALLVAASSDGEAFAAFYRIFERQVLGFFMRATVSPELAADLTAETFARALESLAAYDPARGRPDQWLFGIARNVLGSSYRRGPWGVEHLADPCPYPYWPAARDVTPRELHRPLRVQLQISHHLVTAVQLSFTAPYSVTSAKEDYVVRIPGISCGQDLLKGRAFGIGYDIWSLGRDVTRGSRVTHRFSDLALFSGICGFPRHTRHVARRSAVVEVLYQQYVGAMPMLVGSTTVRLPAGTRSAPEPVGPVGRR